jgi:hypothetical protein
MTSFPIVVVLEVMQLASEITAAPERDLIKQLSTDCADQALEEQMR